MLRQYFVVRTCIGDSKRNGVVAPNPNPPSLLPPHAHAVVFVFIALVACL
jgi:hypothetical protein